MTILNSVLETHTSSTLSDFFTTQNITMPVCLADPDSKLSMQFQTTCYQNKIPGTLGTIYNLAWTHQCFSLLKPDCLLVDASIQPAFSSYLTSKEKMLAVDHLVTITTTENSTPDPNGPIIFTQYHSLTT